MTCNAPSPPEKVLKSRDFRAFSLFFSLFVVKRVVVDPYFDPYRSMELDLMRVMGREGESMIYWARDRLVKNMIQESVFIREC